MKSALKWGSYEFLPSIHGGGGEKWTSHLWVKAHFIWPGYIFNKLTFWLSPGILWFPDHSEALAFLLVWISPFSIHGASKAQACCKCILCLIRKQCIAACSPQSKCNFLPLRPEERTVLWLSEMHSLDSDLHMNHFFSLFVSSSISTMNPHA